MPEVVNELLASLSAGFRIQDALDIAVVAFLFYRMILLIRDTRAIMLLQGIVVIIIFNLVSNLVRLRALSWILGTLTTAGIIAIPIIFQDELRRFLEELGRGVSYASGIATRKEPTQRHDMLKEVARTAEHLSTQRIGALVVLERQTGLQEFMDTGVAIEGVVSFQLLANIFLPNTPLHDGAVLIRGERIAAAACYLPLSSNPNIDQELGTRHRAAIGLTEKSDALVVVVSEETGAIALAQDGKLTRYLDATMLSTLLVNLYEPTDKKIGWRQRLTGGR